MSAPTASLVATAVTRPAGTASAVFRHARLTPGHAERVAHTRELLAAAALDHPGTLVQATSLGVEDQVLTDLIARDDLPIAIATLETGRLHDETLALLDRTEQHYAQAIERWRPEPAAMAAWVAEHGLDAMRQSVPLRKACCGIRKVEPLGRLLEGRTAWITGLRRGQSQARGETPESERDEHGRLKLNPLAAWSEADVWQYVANHGVPYNPLHDAFYPSIGCAPCTRAVALGEDPRAGRWWWEDDTLRECGLHVASPLRPVSLVRTATNRVGPADPTSTESALDP